MSNKPSNQELKEMILELAEICKDCREERWISEDGSCGGTRNAAEYKLNEFISKYSNISE